MTHGLRKGALIIGGALAAVVVFALLIAGSIWYVNFMRASTFAHEGYMALLRGDDEEAVRLNREAVRLNDRNATAWFNLGVALGQLERFDEAVEAFAQAAQRDPRDPATLAALAETRAYLAFLEEDYERSERLYREALRQSAEPRLWQGLGSVLHHAGRIEEAVEAHRAAQRLDPTNAEYKLYLAATKRALAYEAYMAGDYERSEAIYRKATQHAPDDAEAWFDLSAALQALDRFDDAREVLVRARELDPNNESYAQALDSAYALLAATRGFAALESGEYEVAVEAYRKAVVHDPDDHEHWYNLSHALAGLFRFDEARRAIRTAIELDPENADYHAMLEHIEGLEEDSK